MCVYIYMYIYFKCVIVSWSSATGSYYSMAFLCSFQSKMVAAQSCHGRNCCYGAFYWVSPLGLLYSLIEVMLCAFRCSQVWHYSECYCYIQFLFRVMHPIRWESTFYGGKKYEALSETIIIALLKLISISNSQVVLWAPLNLANKTLTGKTWWDS